MPYTKDKVLTGKWNTDDDPRYFPAEDWASATTMRTNSVAGSGNGIGGLSTMTGNALWTNGGLAAGTNTIIGSCDYPAEDSVIFFYHNTSSNHSIWQFNVLTQAWTKIYENALLNFQINKKIFHAQVIDDLLYWTDGWFSSYLYSGSYLQFNPPRKINITKAKNGTYSIVDFRVLDSIKYPPTIAPVAAYTTDNALDDNRLYGQVFQFRYQYVYDDNEVSVWSPISKLPVPTGNEFISGRNWIEPKNDNQIGLVFGTGPAIVTKIRFAFRVGNNEQFYLFAEYDKAEEGWANNSSETINFRNDMVLQPLPLNLENYDLLPQIAAAQEMISITGSSTALAYANIVEGYDRPDINIAVETRLTELPNLRTKFPVLTYYAGGGFTYIFYTSSLFGFIVGDVLAFQLEVSGVMQTVYYEVTSANILATVGMTDAQAIDYLMPIIGDNIATQLGTTGVWNFTLNTYTITGDYANGSSTYVQVQRPTNPQRTLKQGAEYEVAVQYYDRANRDGTVITSEVLEFDVPFPPAEDRSAFVNPDNPYLVFPRVTLTSYPPAEATHYQLLIRRKTIANWQQRSVIRVQDTGNNRFKLSLEKFYRTKYGVVTSDGAIGGAKINQVPQQGDILRFLRRNLPSTQSTMPDYCTTVVELEVLQYSPTEGYNNTECVWVSQYDTQAMVGYPNFEGFVVEIYTPKRDNEAEPWRECGVEMSILNPHTATRYHAGNTQNQTAVLPAIVDMDFGDSYIRPRHMGRGTLISDNAVWWIEDPHISDYYISNYSSIGRIGLENVLAKRESFIATIRHSKPFLQNSSINGLATFEFQDKAELNEKNLAISRLVMLGEVLKVLQERQETSVYIQRSVSVGPNGNDIVAFTDRVFGTIRPMATNFGTSFAGSVVVIDNHMIYYDHINSAFVRSTPGGQVNISDGDYKFRWGTEAIKNYITGIINSVGYEVEIIAFPLRFYGEYQISVIQYKSTPPTAFTASQTWVFNYDKNGWVCSIANSIRWAHSFGEYAFSTNGAQIYEYITSATELSFHGSVTTYSVSVWDNDSPTLVKKWLNVALQTEKAWTVYINSYYNINDTVPYQTHILPSNFTRTEGRLVAGVKKDETDPNFTDPLLALLNGRDMRGNFAILSLTGQTTTTKVFLFSVKCNVIPSKPLP